MQVLVQRNLLRSKNVHDTSLLVEAHTLDGKDVLAVELLESVGLSEYRVDDLLLDSLEIDYTGN
jgi:hypothetical protein